MVLPEATGFGQVAMIDGAQLSTSRGLTLVNAGDAPLVIERWTLAATGENTLDDELVVTGPVLPLTLEARAGENLAELELKLTPRSLGVKSWALTIDSNDADAPRRVVRLTGEVVTAPDCQLEITPNPIAVGFIPARGHQDVLVTLTNLGRAPVERCRLTDLRVSSTRPGALSLPGGNIEEWLLGPGESLRMVVRALGVPPAGEVSGALEFEVSSKRAPHVSVPIAGTVVENAGCLTIAPDDLDFGTLMVGCPSATRYVTLYNTCSAQVVLQSFAITPAPGQPPGSTDFAVVTSPPIGSNGLVLQPGTPATFAVKYTPTDAGNDYAGVRIHWTLDGKDVTSIVALRGTADVAGEQVDLYYQEFAPRLDVLLVLDDSPSMSNDQAQVAANLASYLQYLKATPLDFRLGVISADPVAGAALRTGAAHPDAVLSRASANLEAQFAAKVDVGSSGSGAPRCLEQALTALTPPLVTGANAGFLRPNTGLLILCVTDSTDHSPLPVVDYVNALEGLSVAVQLDAAGGFTAACPGDTGRLASAVTLLQGVKANLCAPDWHTELQYFAFGGFLPRTRFFLTSTPGPSRGLEITVDGAPVPSVTPSGQTAWTYEAASNSVAFQPGFVPEGGSMIEIRYPIACYL